MVKPWFVLALLIVGVGTPLCAAIPGPVSYIGREQGLSNNSVRCIYRDDNGYMWFGTYDGLNQYNGSGFKVFRNKLSDPFSLPHNYIYSITGDKQHQVLVGTGQGLVSYNSVSGRFTPVDCRMLNGQQFALKVHVNLLKTDKNGHVFVCTNGLGLMVRPNGQQVAVQAALPSGSPNVNAQCITFDDKGGAWVIIGDGGLYRYDHAKNALTLADTSIRSASAMAADKRGQLWVANGNGLYCYNMLTRTTTLRNKAFTDILSLHAAADGRLWIGTEGNGIMVLDPQTGDLTHLPAGRNGLSSESVHDMLSDPAGRMWIGTIKGGVNVIDPQKGRFQTISRNPQESNSLVSNFVSSFCEDGNLLYVGTDGGGMSIWDRRNDTYKNYKASPGGLSSNIINSIVKGPEGDIWMATFVGGINRYHPATGSFRQYKCINPLTKFENKSAWLLFLDRDKQLWATTFGAGKLYRYNRGTDEFEMFDDAFNDLLSMAQDADGMLWAGNYNYLIRIDAQKRKYDYFEIGKPVRAIHPDKQGGLWLGTEGGGLVLFKNEKIEKRYADGEGLCNNAVLNILEDAQGHLWLSTFDGLAKFDKSAGKFETFYQGDGLQGNQFLYNAALRLSSGELAFGGINGFNLFQPVKITANRPDAPVVISDLLVNNKPLEEQHITEMTGGVVRALEIPFHMGAFSASFAALEYSSPEKVHFSYKLEGWDKDWISPGSSRSMIYTNLHEGDYTLRVRATNADGALQTREFTMKIKVLPPWYRSWWAWLLYTFSAAGVAYAGLRYKTARQRMKYEIAIAHLDAARQQEDNERKLGFFTNIVHEFRTPLTLIINPVKDMIKQAEEEPEELQTVYRNARRLLSLVDQLMLFRKSESETEELHPTVLDCEAFCHDIYLCFIQQAKARQLDYVFRCDVPGLQLVADRQKIEIALYNLLSNAIKFTPVGGRIVFAVTLQDGQVVISVEDNGEGIPAAAGELLFNKFYQVHRKTGTIGFGIGLYLVKKLVTLHKGTVSYESKEGVGTTFTVTLPPGDVSVCPQTTVASRSQVLETLAEESSVAPKVRSRQEEVVSEKDTMLVVDDNEQMRDYIKKIFADKFLVHGAGSGPEAFDLASQLLPDIIISDVVMDGGDGIELCRRIKNTPALSHIPVILLSGSVLENTKQYGVSQGAEDFITKPFEKDFLVTKVENLLNARNSLQRYFYNEITLQQQTTRISPEYKSFIDDCIKILEAHLQDEDFSVKTLASALGMSHSKLYKRIKLVSGQTANGFIRFIRLRKAAELFINSDCNVSEAAYYVGMRDIKHFREQFNKTFGMNPSEYIGKYRKTLGKNYQLGTTVLHRGRK
ncbi:ATP-binding protein [Chitinophaga horti]|uniref:histidine kinase n=1 Tax=Chitinophaga horti TaxID=2920382 RepID=A0ABY6J4P5_9BACT|nr:hybrid sensor histidine kinase/response regulator transcription factor [Chitinophaga horti]UYQ94336.1 ATP-binding protein [Chitinophaga horti]